MDYNQKVFIIKEYEHLHNLCDKNYKNNNLNELSIDRARISVFVNTIESLFDIDFSIWYDKIKQS